MEREESRNNVGLLSRKLIDGWTLLKEECINPDCKITLITKDNKIFCVSCNSYFRRDANGMLWYARPEEKASVTSLPPTVMKELSKSLPLPPSSSDSQIFPSNSSNFNSSENGTRNQRDHTSSPSIGRRLDFNSINMTPPRENHTSKTSTTPSGQKNLRDGSKVAQKLLEGWTLATRGCSRCNGTLVGDKSNRAFCVTCNEYDGMVKSINPSYPTIEFSKNSQDLGRLSTQFVDPNRNSLSRSLEAGSGRPSLNGMFRETVPLSLENNGKNPQNILENTIRSLYEKMESASQLLEQTSNITDCNKLVSLISECGNSIKILQTLSQ